MLGFDLRVAYNLAALLFGEFRSFVFLTSAAYCRVGSIRGFGFSGVTGACGGFGRGIYRKCAVASREGHVCG